METLILLLGGLNAIEGFLILFFVPGFVISLVFFPRFTDLGLIRRLVYSIILSIGSGIASMMFMNVVLGADTAPGAVSLGLGVFSSLLFVVWLGELWYLNGSVPAGLHQKFSKLFQKPLKYLSTIINSRRDRFTNTTMTRIVWHENFPSGTNQIDHTFLIDIGEVIDIQQVDESRWKFSDGGLLAPPYPRTRNFELFIRESREDGLSLIDDLQLYPVRVTRKPGVTFLGHTLQRGALVIKNRLCKKTDTAEIQWIYTHDFHLFAILYSQDTLGQMVDRVLIKLDEIASSIHTGSRVSSHVEDTQKLRDEFETVVDKPGVSLRRPEIRKLRDESGIAGAKPRVSIHGGDTRKPGNVSGIAGAKPRLSIHGGDTRKPRDETGTVADTPKIVSHGGDPRKFRNDSRIVFDTPRRIPTITEVLVKNPESPVFSRPIDSDRRKLQADIVRDLKVDRVTPGTFGRADRMITSIKIPDRTDLQKILSSIKEIQNDAWLYE